MAEVNCDGAQGKDIKTIQKAIPIPQIAVGSNTRYCNVVQICYELEVEAKVPGCCKNVVMKIPITIGAIPLRFGDAFGSALAFVPPPSAPMSEPRKLRKMKFSIKRFNYFIFFQHRLHLMKQSA